MFGGQAQPVFQLQQLQDAQRVGMGAYRHELKLAQIVQQRLAASAPLDEGVAFAQQHDVAVFQELYALRVLDRGQKPERKVDAPAVQRLGNVAAGQRRCLQAHAWGELAQCHHQVRQKTGLANVAHVDAKHLGRLRRVELFGLVQGLLQGRQRRLHRHRQALGLGGGRDAARGAHKERVLHQQAETGQPLAGGRLGQPQQIGGPADAAGPVHRIEHPQKVEVNLVDMHLANIE